MESSAKSLNRKQHLEALLQMAKLIRDSASYNKFKRQHEVSQSLWEGFCKQIKIVEHAKDD